MSNWRVEAQAHSNPLVRKSNKVFSQNGEDGIIQEILNRLSPSFYNRKITFLEFGVGNGLENNTANLLTTGHSGIWVGAEELAISIPPTSTRLKFIQSFITVDNIPSLVSEIIHLLDFKCIDLFSIDLDGPDIYIAEALLSNPAVDFTPLVFICEVNGKFPPPVEFKVTYDPGYHSKYLTDYFGASITSYQQMLSKYNYTLVAMDLTGVNAFFVRNDRLYFFEDISREIEDLYMPPDYGPAYVSGFPANAKTIELFL